MKVMITGGSGLIGAALTHSLLEDQHQIWWLSRKPEKTRAPHGVTVLPWDGRTLQPHWLEAFSQMDALVNLAGASIGQWPWSESRKKLIIDSRVQAGRVISQAFEKSHSFPSILLQSSGVGYYGPRDTGDPIPDETSPGNDYLATVAVNWESATRIIDTMGVRRVVLRTGLVLARQGGVLPLMALPVRLFAGGPLGSGRQGISWIHLQDQIRAMRFLMQNEHARGAFNLCAPNPTSNADFTRALARAVGRPYWLPVPSFALRLALGEMSDLLLTGQYVIPQRLVNLGFVFKFQAVTDAFDSLYS